MYQKQSELNFSRGSNGKVIINGGNSSVEFLVDPNNPERVKRLTSLEDMTSGTFASGPLELYNSTTHIGAFGAGLTGFVGIRVDGGDYGWIKLGPSGTSVCNPMDYEFSIKNRCTTKII